MWDCGFMPRVSDQLQQQLLRIQKDSPTRSSNHKKSQKLWLEYFRMELLYLQRTVMRRGFGYRWWWWQWKGWGDETSSRGAIQAVFHQAMSEISDVRFAMQFYNLSQSSGSLGPRPEWWNSTVRSFWAQTMFWNALAKSKHNQSVEVAVLTYETVIARIPSVKMFEFCILFNQSRRSQ